MVIDGGDADALCLLPIYTASTLHLHHLLHFCSEAFDGGEELGLVVCRYRELDDVTAPSVAVHIDVNVDGTASVAEEQLHQELDSLRYST